VKRRLRVAALGLAAAVLAAAVPLAYGQVYKCRDGEGRTTYADSPCGPGSHPLRIPNDAPALPPGSTVCAQLHDELNRLAANEAERARPSKRRAALHRQYAERCAGISRAAPEAR
jgi:hypothetical protein